jgi:uncharacterized protein YaaN involved in tellurite resistance
VFASLHYLIRNGTDKIENEEPIIKLGTLENAFEDVFNSEEEVPF